MYSSAVILVIAAIRRDRGIKWYAGPLAAIGIAFSVWHHLIERRIVEESATCAASGTSCAAPYDVSFGSMKYNIDGKFVVSGLPITLAVMAFCAFAAILALLFLPEPLDTTPQTDTQE
jgi:disulfide bond formation protein DsbB